MEPNELITQLYVGYYNRAPDPEGLQYWLGRLAAGVSLADIADSFAASPEAISNYPYLAFPDVVGPDAFLRQIYLNLFNREIDEDGLEYYTDKLESGATTPGQIIAEIQANANTNPNNDDGQVLANKVEVGLAWAQTAASTPGFVYNPDGATGSSAESILDNVTADDATVTAALEEVEQFFGDIENEGDSFTLTAALGENVVGTVDNDTISAVAQPSADGPSTLNVGDQVDGAAGFDTLNLITNVDGVPTGASIEGIERVNLTLGSAVTKVSSADYGSDVEQLWLTGAGNGLDATVGKDVTLGLSGQQAGGVVNVAQTGSTFNVALSGYDAAFASQLVITNAALETINVSGGSKDGDDLYIDQATDTAKNLNVAATTGTISLEVQAMGALTTVDASASTKDVQLDLNGAGAAGLTVTGGAGNDDFYMGTLNIADKIDGGAGEDLVSFSTAGGSLVAQDYLALNSWTNVEVLNFNSAVTVDASKVTSADNLLFSSDSTVNKVADSNVISADDNVTLTVDHATSTDKASAGTVNVDVHAGSTATIEEGGNGFASLVATGAGSIVFDNSAADAGDEATAIDLSGIAADADENGVIDTSLTSDIILNGAVAETVTLSAGVDRIDVTSSTYGKLDTVVGFTASGDYEDGLVANGATTAERVTLAEGDTLAQAFVKAAIQSDTNGTTVFFNYEGNTYLLDDAVGGSAGVLDDADFAVKIVGTYDFTLADSGLVV